MHSPTAALTWEILRRGRRSAWLVLACISFCAVVNRIIPDTDHALFSSVFGFLMVVSFTFLLGLFNCTEYNSTREWNGFPYRLFALPVPTWQLVAVPMLLGVTIVEVLYFGWIKLVWTHQQIVQPEWFAVVLGAYFLSYQMILWSLAGFRIFRTVVLSVGGVSGVLVAVLPAFGKFYPDASPWLSEKRLIPLVLATMPIAFLTAWVAVARQRHSGGRRRNWLKALVEWLVDALPRRTADFPSPAAAQFWFEWRRAGFLLPACVAFALAVVVAPLSWKFRTDPRFTVTTLCWVAGIPVLLGFLIGKGFVRPDIASANLFVPPFLAVRPLPAVEFVAAKLKVAAVSVIIAWLPVVVFVTLWLSLWADTSQLNRLLFEFRMFYPHSWRVIVVLYFVGFMVLTWRCMVSGLWLGLSGKRLYYFGSMGLQVIVPSLLLLACAIWSDDIDRSIQRHPELVKSMAVEVIGWTLALLVIGKLWFAAHSWSKINSRRTRQYVLFWAGATLVLIGLAILSRPPFDTFRQAHLNLLAALFLFPFARLGMAPQFLEKNRAR
jgi:hypothetical protein